MSPAPRHTRLPSDLLTLPAEKGVRVVALALVRSAAQACTQLTRGKRPNALHDFRVAVRRLRSWLRAYRPLLDSSVSHRARRQLKAIAAATGEARDLEVRVTWLREETGKLEAWQRRDLAKLRAQWERKAATQERRRVIARKFKSVATQLERSLASYTLTFNVDEGLGIPQTLAGAGANAIHQAAEQLWARLGAVTARTQIEAAHKARIGAKQLRYIIEPFAGYVTGTDPIVEQLTQLQDSVGEMLDAHLVLREMTPSRPRAKSVAARAPGLTTLVSHARRQDADAFRSLSQHWLGDAGRQFFDAVQALVTLLHSQGISSDQEIERKYLLRAIPPRAREATPQDIEQGYVPGDRIMERLRRVRRDTDEQLVRTIKIGHGLVRTELEETATSLLFETMWPLTANRRLHKRRYVVPDGVHVWEIDEFLDRDLALAEVELSSAHVTVEVPDWLKPYVVRDVTGDRRYDNITLATRRHTRQAKTKSPPRRKPAHAS